jgi:hypothetical protein
MSDQSSNNVAELFSPGPGERLRAARLSMGYDLAKIASELHLTILVVEALEADDYQNVGARVFVRGYLRNYARIVGMPVESILRQFDEKWPDDGALHSMVKESPTLPADGGPSRGWARLMTWLMVIGLIALFLMWWRGYLDEIVPQQIRASNVVDSLKSSVGTTPDTKDSPAPADGGPAPVLEDGDLRLPAASPQALESTPDVSAPWRIHRVRLPCHRHAPAWTKVQPNLRSDRNRRRSRFRPSRSRRPRPLRPRPCSRRMIQRRPDPKKARVRRWSTAESRS